MKKTLFTTFAALAVAFIGLGNSFANTTAECLGINDQDTNTGTCLNYLYNETWTQRSPELTIDEISFEAGVVYVDVCSDMTYFDDTLYLEVNIPSAQRYWKKITEDTFKANECQTISFRIVDTLAPKYYLITAKVTTNLPHVVHLPQDEIINTRASKWSYMASPLRTYSGKRRDTYPVYANERRSKLFPYQQSETHLRTDRYYKNQTTFLHDYKYTVLGKYEHIYKDNYYPTLPKRNAMSMNYYYVP